MSPVFFLAVALAGTWAFFLGVWVGYAMRKSVARNTARKRAEEEK